MKLPVRWTDLILNKNLVENSEFNDQANPVGLLHQAAYLRSLTEEERKTLLSALRSKLAPDWVQWLADHHNSSLKEQFGAMARLGIEVDQQKLTNIVRRRDVAVSCARGVRIAAEIIEHFADRFAEADVTFSRTVLRKIVDDAGANRVVFGFGDGAWLDRAQWPASELEALRWLLWVYAQIEGRIVRLLDVPDGRILVYEEYGAKAFALHRQESIAYTREGLEHFLKLLLNDGNELPDDLVCDDHQLIDAHQLVIDAVLFNAPGERFLKWDEQDKIWLCGGLGARVWMLEKHPLEAKALNTKDRPWPMKSQLRSELANQGIFNQRLPVVVIDDESTEGNLPDYLTAIEQLNDEFGEPLSFVKGAQKRAQISDYSTKVAQQYQQRLPGAASDPVLRSILFEPQTDKRTGGTYTIVADGFVDPQKMNTFVRDSAMYHISGIRNYTFLLFRSRGIETMMNFDDDASPETYCLFPADRYRLLQKRAAARRAVWKQFVAETCSCLGVAGVSEDDAAFYQLFAEHRSTLSDIEQKFFGYAADGTQGLIPRAAEEIVPLSGPEPCTLGPGGLQVSDQPSHFVDDTIELTHQRYESIQKPLPKYNLVVSDFVYPEPRREKEEDAFMVIPVNIMRGARLVGQKTGQTPFMCLEGDLRGTMGVPASFEAMDALREKRITYVPFPFILDQDTSALAQFVRYLEMDEKFCANLQHTDRSALIAGYVRAFVADTYVIFNRSAYDISYPSPSIGQTLRLEEPPLIKWVRAPVNDNTLTVCFSPVAGGQQRAIGERFYMIPFQDFNEQIGGMARRFYERAVDRFNGLMQSEKGLKGADLAERYRSLGRCYVEVAAEATLTETDKRELLEQREYRALLMSRLALQRSAKAVQYQGETDAAAKKSLRREICDLDLILIRYADQFRFYRAKRIPNRERTDQTDDYSPKTTAKDYFYRVVLNGDQLSWCRVTPSMQLGTREDVTNPVIVDGQWVHSGEQHSLTVDRQSRRNESDPYLFELEPERHIALEALPRDSMPIIVPAIPWENESEYLQEIETLLFTQIKQDGQSIYLWPDLVEASTGIGGSSSA